MSFDAMVDKLWARSRDKVLERVATCERAAAAAGAGTLDEPLRAEGERVAHQLAGSLGTYGVAGGSEAAKRLELGLRDGAPAAADLQDAARALRRAVQRRG